LAFISWRYFASLRLKIFADTEKPSIWEDRLSRDRFIADIDRIPLSGNHLARIRQVGEGGSPDS
jgi:hypothetical protein